MKKIFLLFLAFIFSFNAAAHEIDADDLKYSFEAYGYDLQPEDGVLAYSNGSVSKVAIVIFFDKNKKITNVMYAISPNQDETLIQKAKVDALFILPTLVNDSERLYDFLSDCFDHADTQPRKQIMIDGKSVEFLIAGKNMVISILNFTS